MVLQEKYKTPELKLYRLHQIGLTEHSKEILRKGVLEISSDKLLCNIFQNDYTYDIKTNLL